MSQQGEFSNGETFISDIRNSLMGEKLNGASKSPNFGANYYENNLGWEVKTNAPGDDKNYGKIRFGCDNRVSMSFLMTITGLATGEAFYNPTGPEGDVTWTWTNEKPGWKDKPAKVLSKLVAGRKNGKIFVTISEEGRPMPLFFFGYSRYHNLLCNGEETDDNARDALAWATFHRDALVQIIKDNYITRKELMSRQEERKNKNKGNWNKGGGGNWNKGGNNNSGGGNWNNGGGGNNSAPNDFSDDIPF